MLKNANVQAIRLLASKLNDAGIWLSPLGGTPLAKAVSACYTPAVELPSFMESDVWNIMSNITAGTAKPDANNIMAHSDFMEECKKVLGDALRRIITVSRNAVKPIIVEVHDKVTQERTNATSTTGVALSVMPDSYEAIWSSPTLQQLVEPYKNVSALNDPYIYNVFPLVTNEQLLEMLKTGSSRFDKEVESWSGEAGMDFIADTYRLFFAVRGDGFQPGQPGLNINWLMGNTPTERKRALLIHLMARRLQKDIPDGINMPKEDYNVMMSKLIEQSGRAINRVFELRDRDIKAKKLVLRYPEPDMEGALQYPDQAVILVNGDVWEAWLKDGGVPEILFGAYIRDQERDYAALLTNADRYLRAWEIRAALLREAQTSGLFNTTVQAIRKAMTEEINSAEEGTTVGTKAEQHNRLKERLYSVIPGQVTELFQYIQFLVCDVMFRDTDAYRFLRTMDASEASNPNLPAREVALLTSLEIMAEWLRAQWVVGKTSMGAAPKDRIIETQLTLANAVALIETTVCAVAGEDISTHLNGELMMGSALSETIAIKLQGVLATCLPQ